MSEAVLSKAKELSAQAGYQPFYATLVEESGLRLWKSQRIVVISDLMLEFYKETGDSKSKEFSWFDLNLLTLENDHLIMKFGKKQFSIGTTDIKDLTSAIIDVIQRVLTRGELHALKFTDLSFFRSRPNANSIMARFLYKLQINKIELEEETIDYVRLILMTGKTNVNLNDIPETAKVAETFFDILPLIPTIRSLKIAPILGFDIMPLVIDFAIKPSNIKHLHIEGVADESFGNLMRAIKDNSRSRIKGMSFTSCNLTIDHLTLLAETAYAKNFTSLGFHDTISDPARVFFFSQFLTAPVAEKLKYLDLSHTPGIDPRTLLPRLRNIQVLSLENCGCDVSDVFIAFSTSPLPNLRVLNVSSNPFMLPLASSPAIPSNLISLYVNGVTFKDGSFVALLAVIFSKFQRGLRLSISNALASADEWIKVFSLMQSTNFSQLTSLNWDSNPTYPALFDFLSRNPRLENLSLCGCMFESNHTGIEALADFLEMACALRQLVLRGNKTSYLGKYSLAIITALRRCTTLEKLDLSNNGGGDPTILGLKMLIRELPNLRVLIIDGLKPSSSQNFVELLSDARNHKPQIDVAFPERDIALLKKHLMLSQEQVDKLRLESLKPVIVEDEIREKGYRRPKSPYDAPCSLFYDFYTNAFPEFISPEELEALPTNEEVHETIEDTLAPTMGAPEYYVEDWPDENDEARSIASLNFSAIRRRNSSKDIPLTPAATPRSVASAGFSNNNGEGGRKRALASALRRAKAADGIGVPSAQGSPRSVRSGSRVESLRSGRTSGSSRSVKSRNVKRVISPFHQSLTAENLERHSWEFPGSVEIHFDDAVWRETQSQFSVTRLYDEIRNEKSPMSPRSLRSLPRNVSNN